MGIALRHDWRLVPQEPLHLVQIHSGLNHPRRTGMAEIMEMEIGHLGFLQSQMETSLRSETPVPFPLNGFHICASAVYRWLDVAA